MSPPRVPFEELNSHQKSQRTRIYLAMVIASSHFMLMVLGAADRLSFTVGTPYQLLEQALESNLWIFMHGACFVAIVTTVYVKKGVVTALGASTGVMGTWAFLSLLWGLTTPTPVSLAGPILGGAIATLSYLLTASWARGLKVHGKND